MIQSDVAIIGSGLSAVLLARILYEKTHLKVDIFEASAIAGQNYQSINTPFGAMDYGPRVIPNKDDFQRTINFLGQVVGQSLIDRTDNLSLKAVEKGELTDFVGFGFRKPEAIEEWDYYASAERLQLNAPFYSLWEQLLRNIPVQIHTKSEITRLEIENGEVKSAIVNGMTQVDAKAFVICGNTANILELLPQEKLDAKIRQKLSKAKYWTSIGLNLVHRGEISSLESPVALLGPGDTPFMGFGYFYTPRQETGKLVQFSQWMTLVAAEQDEAEEEAYAHALREMKKLLQKGFPKILDSVEYEKIAVDPLSHGQCRLKFEKEETVHGYQNLWHCHSSVAEFPNTLGDISRAEIVANHLMKRFESFSRDLPEASESPSLLHI